MFNKITVFALAAMVSSFGPSAWAQDCNLKQYASLPMTFMKNGEIGVPVTIAGKNRLFMLVLDAVSSAVTPRLVKELNLDVVTVIPGQDNGLRITIAGQRVVRTTHIPEMHIGEASGKDLAVAVLDHPMDLPEEDGVIGADILSKFDVELDFAKGALNLYSKDHCPGQVVYWSKTYTDVPFEMDDAGEIYFQTMLDDKPLKAWISTAAGPNIIALHLSETLFGLHTNDLTLVSDDEDMTKYRYSFKLLTMGDIAIRNPDFLVEEAKHRPLPHGRGGATALDSVKIVGPEIVLQRNFLKHLHLYFAFGEKKLYITGADAHK